jgi:DNA-binding response OmpR family regulator
MPETKVLVIDDNIDLTTIVSMILRAEGFLVQVCNTIEEGLFFINDWKPEVLLLDVNVDGEDGRLLCQKIKLKENGEIRIILMSGDETTLDHKEWNGADDCIVKPFESAELLQKISSRSQNLIPGT